MDERAACALLKARFEAAGFQIEENRPFSEAGVQFEIDGYDPIRRVGYEYVSEEAGDTWDVDTVVIGKLDAAAISGDVKILIVKDKEAPDEGSLGIRADAFLAQFADAEAAMYGRESSADEEIADGAGPLPDRAFPVVADTLTDADDATNDAAYDEADEAEASATTQPAANKAAMAKKPAPKKPAPRKPAPRKPAPRKPAPKKPAPEKPAPEKPVAKPTTKKRAAKPAMKKPAAKQRKIAKKAKPAAKKKR